MRKVILNDVINIISGGTPKTSIAEYWNGDIGWLSVVDFNNDLKKVYSSDKKITELGLKNSSTKMLEIGDIIISARGTVGALAQIGTPMCFNQSCFGLRGKQEFIINDYLYYALKNYISNIKKRTQGSVFETINLDSFKLMEINIHSDIDTQKIISNVLSLIDDKIEVNNKVNQELESIQKFLDGAIEMLKPNGRLAVISFHSLEDRIVKQTFKRAATDCLCPPKIPQCICQHRASVKLLTKKPICPTIEETRFNPRSSSAKLRVICKL